MVFFSTIEPVYYLLPLVGLVVGLFGTMLGGGGGFFILPVLTLGLKLPTQTAVISTLVATLPICLVGSWGHYKKGNIDTKIGTFFSLIGISGAFLGATISGIITNAQFQIAFGVYAVLIALNIIITTKRETKKIVSEENKQKPAVLISRMVKSGFFAFSAGIITGIFGTSGTASILAGLFNLSIPVKVAIGTSLIVVLVNTLFAIGVHSLTDSIDLTLVGLLTTGSVFGTISGVKLLARSKIEKSEARVKHIYAIAMIVLGILMITKK